ncbi:sigma factor regulatory protein FecR [Leptospira kobayashii]|uniref:Sigma factor regulatory protein FecR n=1 Tax=Leptospira kobayashii TaxID=1917830 RepID=A0ABM7UIZ4_9LEPT|nr:FecR family protein [Leptospira kobayashii]BDA78757.1 sigma factor regulatory protein FecR [Leptospira kobayashii]
MRFFNDTKYVVTFLLSLIGLFSFLLYKNLTARPGESDSPTIGVLTFKTKTVLRKYNDQVVWDNIESRSEVKNRDTIRTEGFSDAVLTLNDGTKINIAENSMILLDISEKNININFAYGAFDAARDGGSTGETKMNITSGDKTVEVGKGDVKLDKTKDELNVKVGEGEAKIHSNGKEETVGKDQMASVSKEGVKVSKPKFSLVSPPDKKNYFVESGNETVNFAFNGVTQETLKTSPTIEVSASHDFAKLILKDKIKSGSYSKSLGNGSYYWRIAYLDPESKTKQFSETGRFRVLTDPPLRLFSPKEGDNYNYTNDLPVVKIVWNQLDLYSSYTAQIAEDPGFTKGLKSKQTQNQSIAFDGLGDGTYFARVVAKSNMPDVQEKTSSVSKFTVGKKLNLEPPVILEPAKGKVFTKDQIQNNIFFTWKDNKDFPSFALEVSSDSNFSKTLIKQTTQSNFLKLGSDLNEGNYFWRVRGTQSGKEDIVSSIGNFSIVAKEDLNLVSPNNGSDVEANENGGAVLRWKKLSAKSEYVLEVSKSPDFSSVILKETTSNHYLEVKLKEFGKYYWRVTGASNSGNTSSDSWSFSFNTSMEAPVLVTPTRGETIDLLSKTSIAFTWKPTEKAIGYRIRLIDISGVREKQVFSERVTQPKYGFNDLQKLNEGRFRVELCSLYGTTSGEKESVYHRSEFYISLPAMKIPKILTPGKIYVE